MPNFGTTLSSHSPKNGQPPPPREPSPGLVAGKPKEFPREFPSFHFLNFFHAFFITCFPSPAEILCFFLFRLFALVVGGFFFQLMIDQIDHSYDQQMSFFMFRLARSHRFITVLLSDIRSVLFVLIRYYSFLFAIIRLLFFIIRSYSLFALLLFARVSDFPLQISLKIPRVTRW